jgi:hypothetical protein
MKRLFLMILVSLVLLFNTNSLFAQCNPYGAWNLSFVKGKEKVDVVVAIKEENNEPILTLSDKEYKGKIIESKCILEFKDPEDNSLLSLTVKGEQIKGEEIDEGGNITSKVSGYKEAHIIKVIDNVYLIKAGTYSPITFDLFNNGKIILGYEVIWGGDKDINFTLLDELNYFKWKANDSSATFIISRPKSTSFSNIIDLSSGKYYIILGNSFSLLTDKKVRLKIYRIEKTSKSKSFPISVNEICANDENKYKVYEKLGKIYKKCDISTDYRSDTRMDNVCLNIFGGKDKQIEEDVLNNCLKKIPKIKCKDFQRMIIEGFEWAGVDNICTYLSITPPENLDK